MTLPRVAKIQLALASLLLVSYVPAVWELFRCGYCSYNQHVTPVLSVVGLSLIVGFTWFTVPAGRSRLLRSLSLAAGISLVTLLVFIYFMP